LPCSPGGAGGSPPTGPACPCWASAPSACSATPTAGAARRGRTGLGPFHSVPHARAHVGRGSRGGLRSARQTTRAALGGSGAEGVGRLQGMASLNAALTPTALADVAVELPVSGPARDLHLELLSAMSFVERTAAIGEAVWQGCLVDLVDQVWGGRQPVGLGALVLARLAAGLAGIRFRLALGEGSCLALAGPEGGVELPTEPLVLGLQIVDPSLKGSAVGTPDRFHAGMIRSSETCNCDDGRQG